LDPFCDVGQVKDQVRFCLSHQAWSSSVEGGTTLPLGFPFQQKAWPFYLIQKSLHQ